MASFATRAAALGRAASARESSQEAQLGVTATVVRPAEIITFPAPLGEPVALIRNSEAIEVVAEGGTVRPDDGETAIVPNHGSTSVTVTLIC